MPTPSDRPYGQFNFLVDFGGDPAGGFSECSGIDAPMNPSDFRTAGTKGTKPGRARSSKPRPSASLRRGVIAAPVLYSWLTDIQSGARAAARDVTLQLQGKDHASTIKEWKLVGARIVKHVAGPMNAKGTNVAIEEMDLEFERIEAM